MMGTLCWKTEKQEWFVTCFITKSWVKVYKVTDTTKEDEEIKIQYILRKYYKNKSINKVSKKCWEKKNSYEVCKNRRKCAINA